MNIVDDYERLVKSTSQGYNDITLVGGVYMEKKTVTRKTDKRTLYTKGAVKDALLVLLESNSFEKITGQSQILWDKGFLT